MTMNGGQIRFYLRIYCRTLGILWYMYKWTTTVHFFITVNDSLRQHESGHFLTYGHFMSRPTAFHCRTPDLY
jgi:hypothetical protein